jgi:hypothetical protein
MEFRYERQYFISLKPSGGEGPSNVARNSQHPTCPFEPSVRRVIGLLVPGVATVGVDFDDFEAASL